MGKSKLKIEYLRLGGVEINPNEIHQLNIYESLEFPGVTGDITFKDLNAVKEIGVYSGDSLKIAFGKENDTPLVLEFDIYSGSDDYITEADPNSMDTSFKFCSKWLLNGLIRKRSRSFSGQRIDEIVRALVIDSGGSPGFFIKTKQTLDRFVSPYWNPITTINYLGSFATDDNGLGGYTLWTDIETGLVNFAPLGVLMHTTRNYGSTDLELAMDTGDPRSPRKVFSIEVDSNFNLIDYGTIGLGRTKLAGFDYDRMQPIEIDKTADEYQGSHLSTVLPINDKYQGRSFRFNKRAMNFPNTDELIRNDGTRRSDEFVEGKWNTRFANLSSDVVRLNVSVVGDTFFKRAGTLIKIKVPRPGDNQSEPNQLYSGTYLVRNVRHVITGMEYGQFLTLVSDGLKETTRVDLVSWNDPSSNIRRNVLNGDEYDIDVESERGTVLTR